jgi:phosphoenolpyruvate carboxylase
MDIAPLFETVDDLDAAAATLRALFADPLYREHLAARGQRQVVMLGYSDSARTEACWPRAGRCSRPQVALTRLARDSGVRIAFFHGRGGSISRGGGKTERAVIAMPRGSVDGYLRLTEQGEVIHRKYGISRHRAAQPRAGHRRGPARHAAAARRRAARGALASIAPTLASDARALPRAGARGRRVSRSTSARPRRST